MKSPPLRPPFRLTAKRQIRLALSLLAWHAAASALAEPAPLGRLFFSPAERQVLDQTANSDAGPHPRPVRLHYQGLVQRQGQATTLWLNGQAVRPAELTQHFADTRLQLGGEQSLLLPGKPAARLRPGESTELVTAAQP